MTLVQFVVVYCHMLSIYVSKVWRKSFSSITVQSYIVVMLSSSFILLLVALLIVRHGYDYNGVHFTSVLGLLLYEVCP